MNKPDPFVLVALQGAGFSDDQIAGALNCDERTINDYLDYFSTGFDCALFYIGRRLEKSGFTDEQIEHVLGTPNYPEMKDYIMAMPDWDGMPKRIERIPGITPEQIDRLRFN